MKGFLSGANELINSTSHLEPVQDSACLSWILDSMPTTEISVVCDILRLDGSQVTWSHCTLVGEPPLLVYEEQPYAWFHLGCMDPMDLKKPVFAI